MNVEKVKRYQFSTDAQWNACRFVRADRDLRRKSGGIRPFAPYARPGTLYESRGAHAPAVTHAGEILWRDDYGAIHRLPGCTYAPRTSAAPLAITRAARLVTTSSGLWVIGDPPDTLQRYEDDTFTRLLTFDLPNARVVDIANGGHGSLLALVEREIDIANVGYDSLLAPAKRQKVWQSVRVDRSGHDAEPITFNGITHAEAFVFLRRSQRFVLLAGERYPRLYWFSAKGGAALFSLAVAAMHPCFKAHVLGSDTRDRVFLAGADGDECGGRAYVLIFDSDGNSLGELPLDSQDAPAKGIAARRDSLLVTGQRGLLRFPVVEVVPEGAGPLQCTLMTPSLFSPDREDQRRWLRIEATASLPEGTTLEISWAATDDTTARDRLNALATDDAIPASRRVATLVNEPDLRRGRTLIQGAAGSKTQGPKTYSAKLFDVKERYLWVDITLTAATSAPFAAPLRAGRPLSRSNPDGGLAGNLSKGGRAARQLPPRWSACSRPRRRDLTRASVRWVVRCIRRPPRSPGSTSSPVGLACRGTTHSRFNRSGRS